MNSADQTGYSLHWSCQAFFWCDREGFGDITLKNTGSTLKSTGIGDPK
ncbi:hypothetical protein P872_04305 [Rhodonellum psychrophilum GCM71 = DSM 17998]|uniref:Uncharacterized protein n=1 Tax=Rhodonellum psychrophilum GCM71 = DSM 17998 TaxID=1123057 RepID=U5BQA0_9BACT|nr:hypothetical protein P872_04305 [Rhodonellum psychrophilum GCM71 = DSM 17998]